MDRSLGHSSIFLSAYDTLGNILKNLSSSLNVNASPELLEQVRHALLLHKQLQKDFSGVIQQQEMLRKELSELTRDPGEIVCDRHKIRAVKVSKKYEKYRSMKNTGLTPKDVYLAAKTDGIGDSIMLIRILRSVFDLSLSEAQEVITLANAEV